MDVWVRRGGGRGIERVRESQQFVDSCSPAPVIAPSTAPFPEMMARKPPAIEPMSAPVSAARYLRVNE